MLDRIMLTNDDGIDAPGMEVMEAIAAQIAREVWVVAPEHDQSGQSHAISLHHALRVSDRGNRRYGVTGTPGDCAAMGLCHLMAEHRPQLVLSGVNRGLNLGLETVFSGTVGGAMTAMMLGVPALALSQAYTNRRHVNWDASRTCAPDVIRRLLAMGWGKDAILNINFPDLPADQVGERTWMAGGHGLHGREIGGHGLGDHRVEQLSLAGEVEIERALGDARPGGDLVQPGGGEPLLGEHRHGRPGDLGRAVGLAATELRLRGHGDL